MPSSLGDLGITDPVLLAPMAGITDRPFRTLAARFGAGLVVSEMVASGELLTGRAETVTRAEIAADEPLTAVQIAGREADPMAQAAAWAAWQGARIIDINMGCPAKKVTSGLSGSALMRDPDHALRLIEAVVGAVDVPVTLKMRLGWDRESLNAPQIARRAEAAGIRMITVHGRTRCDFYQGQADWAAIRAVVEAVAVPVVANGDITDTSAARAALAQSGAAAVMVGRGAQGAPWQPGVIAADLAERPRPAIPKGSALASFIAEHLEAHLAHYGVAIGLRSFRKHMGWYLARLPGGAALRPQAMRAETPAALLEVISGAFQEALSAEAERQAA
ncbi:MAG: tRNA dihydrouridine synthase DusB [Pseudomonadota bacterium]